MCARFGMECIVYMGEEDTRRQRPNVVRMGLLGAEVRAVTAGTATLKDAMNEAIRDWIANVEDTHYLIGSAAGPHPYPLLVRELQAVISREARAQLLEREDRLPDAVVACVGGGSNAIGAFHAFRDDPVRLIGVEAGRRRRRAPRGLDRRRQGLGAARLAQLRALRRARPGRREPLDLGRPRLPGRRARARVTWPSRAAPSTCARPDAAGARGFHRLCRLEGIIPALESAHALSTAERVARELGPDGIVLVCLSGPRRQGRRHRRRSATR